MVEFVTIKYDTNGKQQWIAKYQGPKRRRAYASNIHIDQLGNIYTKGNIEHPRIRREAIGVIIKYDKNGKEQWVTYHERNLPDEEVEKMLLPTYRPAPEKTAARWFETQRAVRKEALMALIKKSSDINAEDKLGETLLEKAADQGFVDIVKMLLGKGAKITDRSICAAIQRGQSEVVKILFEVRGEITPDSPCVFQALSSIEEPNVVKAFLEAGLDAKAKDKRGDSLLDWPMRLGQTEIVKLLLEAGFDPNEMKSYEEMVFDAIGSDQVGIVKVFLEAGVSPNTKNKYDGSLLEKAVFGRNTDMVQILLDSGAKLPEDKRACSEMLYQAAEGNSPDIVKILLKLGVRPAKYDDSGWTIVHSAVYYSGGRALRFLLEEGFDPNAKDSKGVTPLGRAKEWDKPKMIKILQEFGAKE